MSEHVDNGADDYEERHVQFPGVKCFNETARAILVRLRDGEEAWIPKSTIHDDSEVYKDDDEGTLIVSRSIAEDKGLV